VVNVADAQALSNNIFSNNSFWSYGDFDFDGTVDLDDAQAMSNNFNLSGMPVTPAPTISRPHLEMDALDAGSVRNEFVSADSKYFE